MNKTIKFYYRGLIEAGKNYRWVEGYSANSENGKVLYPWQTRRRCQAEAKAEGLRAVFIREVTP